MHQITSEAFERRVRRHFFEGNLANASTHRIIRRCMFFERLQLKILSLQYEHKLKIRKKKIRLILTTWQCAKSKYSDKVHSWIHRGFRQTFQSSQDSAQFSVQLILAARQTVC